MTRTTFQRRRRLLQLKHQQLAPFNPILTLMNSWKTTIVGALLAGLAFLSIFQANGGDLAHWQQWVIPFCIAALGWVAKDNNVSGKVPMILAGLLCLLCVACTSLQRQTALERIKSADVRVLEAGGKAAAQQALNEAEQALADLEAVPLRENASAAELAAWAAAITEGRNQVTELRRRVAELSFTGK